MDPVTIAVIAALAALGNATITEAGKRATADAYEALKRKIRDKFGDSAKLPVLLDSLKGPIESDAVKSTLNEEAVRSGASTDKEIASAAAHVMATVSAQQGGTSIIINAGTVVGHVGNYGNVKIDNLNVK